MLLRRSNVSNSGFLGSPEPGVLYDNQSTEPTVGPVGSGAGRNRFPNLFLTRNRKRQARCVFKAFGVPPEKGGGRKPADHDGFTGKKPGPGKPRRKKKCFIHLRICPVGLATSKKMERRIPAESPRRREKGHGLPEEEEGSGAGRTDSERPKGQGTNGGFKKQAPVPKELALGAGRDNTAGTGIRTRL